MLGVWDQSRGMEPLVWGREGGRGVATTSRAGGIEGRNNDSGADQVSDYYYTNTADGEGVG